MAIVTKIIKITSAGVDTGTFTIISDNGTTLLTGVTRQQLLDGVAIQYEEANTTLITVVDNGSCGGTVSIEVTPPTPTYYYIGDGEIVNNNTCNLTGEKISIYLNAADKIIYEAQGNCLVGGLVIRNDNGTVISNIYEFVFNLQTCTNTTFKNNSSGVITIRSPQC